MPIGEKARRTSYAPRESDFQLLPVTQGLVSPGGGLTEASNRP